MGSRPVPGVYEDLAPPIANKPLRDDIAGFVGLTRRGPIDRAVYIESWEAFVSTFGERADSIATPDAVLGFFINGGRSAYIVRVLDRDHSLCARAECLALQLKDPSPTPPRAAARSGSPPAAVSESDRRRARIKIPMRLPSRLRPRSGPMLPVSLPLQLAPRPATPQKPTDPPGTGATPPQIRWFAAQYGIEDRGAWANGLRCELRFVLRELLPRPENQGSDRLRVYAAGESAWGRSAVEPGALLYLAESKRFAAVRSVRKLIDQDARNEEIAPYPLLLELDRPLPVGPLDHVFIIEATLNVQGSAGREHFGSLGLCPEHPRYLPEVLRTSSRLVGLEVPGTAPILYPVELSTVQGAPIPSDEKAITFLGTPPLEKRPDEENPNLGADGLLTVKREHFFGPEYDEEYPANARGLSCLSPLDDVSLVLMPDLVLPAKPLDNSPPVLPGGPPPCKRTSWSCGEQESPPRVEAEPELVVPTFLTDPLPRNDRIAIDDLIKHQLLLVAECTRRGDRTALLCPPPSASPQSAILWRSRFSSAFAAAYYPWLHFGDAVTHPPVRLVPPVGVAAGIIARTELQFGVGRAPANQGARFCSGLSRQVDDNEWAKLHEVSFNVFRQLPNEIRLLGARTLSSDIQYRYLHVRRLITHIKRALYARMQWVVFESNGPALWAKLRRDIEARILRPLFDRGAFAGDTPETSYFIRCDEVTNPRQTTDQGRLICEIGVAPSAPSEYIVFRLSATRNEKLSIGEVD